MENKVLIYMLRLYRKRGKNYTKQVLGTIGKDLEDEERRRIENFYMQYPEAAEVHADIIRSVKDRGLARHIIETSLEDVERGKGVSYSNVIHHLATEQALINEIDIPMLEGWKRRGIFNYKGGERDYEHLKEALVRRKNSVLGGLEKVVKKAAVYICFILSGGFITASLMKAVITGAIIGGGVVDYNTMVGVALLLLGFALNFLFFER